MKECINIKKNAAGCACTYEPCGRKGRCCECVQYHLKNKELPGCFFPEEIEKTYDRSVKKFVTSYKT